MSDRPLRIGTRSLLSRFCFLILAVMLVRAYVYSRSHTPAGVSFSDLSGAVAKSANRVYKFLIRDMCAEGRATIGGSAIVFGSTILTARHIFDYLQSHIKEGYPVTCFSQEFVSFDGTDTVRIPLRLPDFKLFKDIVRIRTDGIRSQGDPGCFSVQYKIGDSIYIAGYPGERNYMFTVLKGKIVGTHHGKLGELIISRGDPAGPGMSGGAAIDGRGCIIGMLTRVNKMRHMNSSTPLKGAEDWVQ